MAGSIQHSDNDMLRFKDSPDGSVSLKDLGDAMKAYDALVVALEHRKPKYTDFTAFLLREGYVEKEGPSVPPKNN